MKRVVSFLFAVGVMAMLALGCATASTVHNYIKNGSFTKSFDGWSKGGWGNNSSVLELIKKSGHGDKTCLKVTVKKYVDGDAKWLCEPLVLVPGRAYQFLVWYKASAEPKAVAHCVFRDGTERFFRLKRTLHTKEAAKKWTLFKDEFVVPANAVTTDFFMMLDQNGWLMTDDYAVHDCVLEPFARPLLTIALDDGLPKNVDTIIPLLAAYGFESTHFYLTSSLESIEAIEGMQKLDRAGHEIGSHTNSHVDLTQLASDELRAEILSSKLALEAYLQKPVDLFASPFGDYDANVIRMSALYYRSHRTADEGYNTKENMNVNAVKVRSVFSDTTADEVAEWVNGAMETNSWLVLLYHRVVPEPGRYDTTPEMFGEHMEVVAKSGITVVKYSEALDELVPQLQ